MRKSKVETAETRKRIVSMASRVFLEHGLAATGIADIMAAAGLTQGGFYRHFESKEHLIAEASEEAYDQLYEMLGKKVAGMSPRDTLDTIVHMYLYQRQAKNNEFLCPLAHLGSELPHADAHVKAIVNSGYQRMVGYIASLVQQLGIADHVSIADAIVSALLGAVIVSRLALTEASTKAVLVSAQNTVNIILTAAPKIPAAA